MKTCFNRRFVNSSIKICFENVKAHCGDVPHAKAMLAPDNNSEDV